MKNVKLIRLELTNYRNIDHSVLEFDGNSKIVGDNRVGKTNTLEAIYWLLSDKLLSGSSDIAAIKPLSDTKKVVTVSGTFDVDGQEITLAKVYGENWVQVRGTCNLELRGHYTRWFYNGVEQGTYKAYLNYFYSDFGISVDLGKIDVMRLLIDPIYLGELGEGKDWTELRSFIIKLIGDVSDDDVFAADPRFLPMRDDLLNVNGRTDQLKKLYKSQIDNLSDAIIGNEAQIDMLSKIDKPTDDEIAVARKAIEEIDDRIAKLQNAKTVDAMSVTLQSRINEKREEYNSLTLDLIKNNPLNKEELDIDANIKTINDEIYSISNKDMDAFRAISQLESDIDDLKDSISSKEQKRLSLIDDLRELDSQIKNVANDTTLTICPVCKRPLDDASEIISHRIAELESKKQDLIADGKKNTETLNAIRDELKQKESELESARSTYNDLEKTLIELKERRATLDNRKHEIYLAKNTEAPSSPELEVLATEIKELEDRLATCRSDDAKREEEVRNAIRDEAAKKEPFGKILISLEYYGLQMKQLENVKTELNTNQRKLAVLEQKREMVNAFIFLKLKMLDEKVESVFGHIKFQLIQMNLNGGYDPVCKPYIYNIDKDESTDVTWKSGSKSERIVTGIAIAERIKAKLDLPNFPFLFDEGGEISSDTFATKFKTDSQLICVKVQDNINKPIVLKI